jgi:hypothetical protein
MYKNKMQMLSNTALYTFVMRKTAVAIDLMLLLLFLSQLWGYVKEMV